jgi:DNA-binding NarL/FixJ family response regulator
MKIFKVGIADDHMLFADGISKLISPQNRFVLSFVTASAGELPDLIRHHNIDILILDVNIPPFNGLEQILPLKEQFPGLQIMILTMYQPIDIGLQMNQFFGDAYVLKISGKQIFEDALNHLAMNQPFFDPGIIEATGSDVHPSKQPAKLTRREKEIIALIAAGKTTKEIAAELFLSELTIKTHRKNISEKLGSRGIADLISKTSHFRKL